VKVEDIGDAQREAENDAKNAGPVNAVSIWTTTTSWSDVKPLAVYAYARSCQLSAHVVHLFAGLLKLRDLNSSAIVIVKVLAVVCCFRDAKYAVFVRSLQLVLCSPVVTTLSALLTLVEMFHFVVSQMLILNARCYVVCTRYNRLWPCRYMRTNGQAVHNNAIAWACDDCLTTSTFPSAAAQLGSRRSPCPNAGSLHGPCADV
jgi:hypothetical protein